MTRDELWSGGRLPVWDDLCEEVRNLPSPEYMAVEAHHMDRDDLIVLTKLLERQLGQAYVEIEGYRRDWDRFLRDRLIEGQSHG